MKQVSNHPEFIKRMFSNYTTESNYKTFNNYIRDRFFSIDQTSETIIFAVDENVINDFLECRGLELKAFQSEMQKELKYSWRHLTINKNDCFGICAIQVYIAHQMRKDGEFSSGVYNPRLANFLNVDNAAALQSLYSESQNKLWSNLKFYCEKNHFRINIPSQATGKGCYVQYPFSQTRLNKEDLKKTSILFERVGIKKTEYLPIDEFSRLIENADNGLCMNSHYYKVKERLFKISGTNIELHQQIFNYFLNDWDGTYLQSLKTPNQSRNSIVKETTNIILDRKYEKVIVFNDEYEEIKRIDITNKGLFKKLNNFHRLYNNDFLIFEKDNVYEEPKYVRKFEIGKQYVLICDKKGKASAFISSLSEYQVYTNSFYNIFLIEELWSISKHPFWSKYFLSQSRNYKIEGGLKLGYNIWMYGAGPMIYLNPNSTAWLNGKRVEDSEFDCSQLAIGSYKLKIEGYPPEKLEIRDANYTDSSIGNGWKISRSQNCWNHSSLDSNIIGLRVDITGEVMKASSRIWIDSLTQNRQMTRCSHQLINAINRSKGKK